MLARVDSDELEEWLILMRLEPFGPQALNLNFGILASIMANAHRGKNKAAVSPQDMALGVFGEAGKQSTTEMKELMMQLVTSTKGKKKEKWKKRNKKRK